MGELDAIQVKVKTYQLALAMSKVVLAEEEIHKDKLITMAEKIAEEYPEDLRAKETLCEVLCIFGHMEYLHNKKKDKNIDRAYELYRQIKDQTNDRFFVLAGSKHYIGLGGLKSRGNGTG